MKNQNTRKIQIVFFILLAAAALATGIYLAYQQLNPSTQASVEVVRFTDYRPTEIIEGETETILVNGSGFNESCNFFLGRDELEINFMNTVSAELVLPEELNSETLKVTCENTVDFMTVKISPKLETLP